MLEMLESRVFFAVTVAVDGAVRYQTMDGFGSSLRVFDDPHVFENFNPATRRAATILTPAQQGEVMDRLYRDLKLTRVRPVSPDTAVGAGIEPVNDNSNPNVTDLSKFNFAWKNLDAHTDYLVRARERGATTFFHSPLNRESWMGTTTLNDAAEYGEWLLAQVRRSAERGVRLPYLAVANEPSYGRNSMSGEFIRDVIKHVGPRLRAEGFDTMFVTTDDVRPSNAAAKARVVLADPVARQYVGALATHLYDESVTNVGQMKALAEQYQLPLWMTEFSMSGMPSAGRPANPFAWASLMHDLISTYNVSAVDYMWGFFGEWEGNSSMLITLNNTGATYDGYTLNKTYYTTGQFSRFVEPGAERIKAQSTDATVQATAFLDDDGDLVIVAINNGALNQQTTFSLSGLAGFDRVDVVRTSGSENWATLAPVSVSGSGFSTVLPHNSVTTFVAEAPSTVVGRHIFYNNSFADGRDGAANASDDAAVATGKAALLPGQAATFANITSYSRGLNGVMVDILGLPERGELSAADVVFATGDGMTWSSSPQPRSVSVRRGAGAGGSDRVTIVLADNAVRNAWLRVTVLANSRTGLAVPDVFYFGNLVAETGSGDAFKVDAADLVSTRRSMHTRAPAQVERHDFDRDGAVNVRDLVIVRSNQRRSLLLLSAPAAPANPTAAGSGRTAAFIAAKAYRGQPLDRRGVWIELNR